MSEQGALQKIIIHLVKAYKPLADAASESSDGSGIVELVKELGFDLSDYEDLLPVDLETMTAAINASYEIIAIAADGLESHEQLVQLMRDLRIFVIEVEKLDGMQINAADIPADLPGEVRDEIIVAFQELGKRLLDYLIIKYLQREGPVLHNTLILIGIIKVRRRESAGPMLGHVSWWIEWGHITKLLSEPEEVFRTIYGWSTPNFDPYLLFKYLRHLLWLLNVPAGLQFMDPEGITHIDPNYDVNDPNLRIPILWKEQDGALVQLGASLLPVRKDASEYEGLALVSYGLGEAQQSFDLGDGWSITFSLTSTANIKFGFLLRLGRNIEVGLLDEIGPIPNVDLSAELSRNDVTDNKIVFFGSPGGTRMEASSVGFKTTCQIGLSDRSEYSFELFINEAMLLIEPSEGDRFIQKILPSNGIKSNFQLVSGWSSIDGLYFKGSAGLEITIPVHKSIGPVNIYSVYVFIGFEEKTITTILTTSIGAKIGPVDVSVDRIGMKLPIGFPENRDGNIGSINLGVPQFHPPKGAGASIETEAFNGAGYLDFDEENKRYVGMLQIEASGYGVDATGLITTKMPDGSNGFSMLAIISAVFNPGISLGAGFFLEGVGGLVGINRQMLVDNIRQGIRDRSIDSILYPDNIVLNASRIISDLRGTFPPTEGRYVFGPIARITFAHYVQGEIGFMIEVPGPVRPVLLGQTALILSEGENVQIEVHEDILGTIDFANKTISYDASIYDSRILIFSLTGDSAFRLSWGDQPNFALAIGGLNPRYTPPPNFPTMNRLRLSLGYRDIARINLDLYLAITSNSFHHGARIEVNAEKGNFSLHGHLGFDTLIQFSPFYFAADVGSGVAIKFKSKTIATVQLNLTLSGPQPWQFTGKATFKFLRFKRSIPVNATWGGGAPATLEPVDPWPLLKTAFDDPGNWEAVVPESTQVAVTLRKPEISGGESPSTDSIVFHPMAGLKIRQRVLPLNMEMDLFGNAPIVGDKRYSLTRVQSSAVEVAGERDLDFDYGKEYFASAQYQSMSDDAKLSVPAFEKLDATILVGAEDIDTPKTVSFKLTHEPRVIDDNRVAHGTSEQGRTTRWRSAQYQLAGSAARAATISATGLQTYAPPGAGAKVTMAEEGYRIVGTENMSLHPEIEGNDGSLTHAEAVVRMQEYLASHPEEAGNIQVTPSYEAAA